VAKTLDIAVSSSGLALLSRRFKSNERDLRRLGTTGARTCGILSRSASKASAGFGKLRAAILSIGIAASAKKVLNFSGELGQLQANAKLTNKEAQLLKKTILETGVAHATTKEQILKAANVLQDFGGILKGNIPVLKQLGKLQEAFGGDAGDIATVYAVLNKTLGLAPKAALANITALADQANAATVRFGDLARILPRVLSLGKGRGFTGKRAIAQLGPLLQGLGAGTGGNADRVATQFTAIFKALTESANVKLLAKKGINPFKNAKGDLKDMSVLLPQIFSKFKGLIQLQKIFKDSESQAGIGTLFNAFNKNTGKLGGDFKAAQKAGAKSGPKSLADQLARKRGGIGKEAEQLKRLMARFDKWLQTFGAKLIKFVSADPKKAALIAGGTLIGAKVAKGLITRLFQAGASKLTGGASAAAGLGVQKVFVTNFTPGSAGGPGGAAGKVGAALGVVGVGAAAFMLAKAADNWLNISGKLADDAAALRTLAQGERMRQAGVGVSQQVRGAGVTGNAKALLAAAKGGVKSFEDSQRPGSRRALNAQNATQTLLEQAQGGIGPQAMIALLGTLGKLNTTLQNQKVVVSAPTLDGTKAQIKRGGSAI